jgi:hypothetical protein
MTHRSNFSSARRVSFEGDELPKRRCVGLTSRGMAPLVSTAGRQKFSRSESTPSSILKKNEQQRRDIVLHGRVVKNRTNESSQSHRHWDEDYSYTYSNAGAGGVRNTFDRKYVFSQLSNEMKQFQHQVLSLEQFIRGQQPDLSSNLSSSASSSELESGWRIRALIKASQESEKLLWTKLYDYEKTLLVHQEPNRYSYPAQADDLRDAQTACMKLHRDFKRCHKALLMCVSLAEGNDPGDAAPPLTDSVGWTGISVKTEIDTRDVMSPHPDRPALPQSLPRSLSPVPEYTSFRPHPKDGAKRTQFAAKQHEKNTDSSYDPLNEESDNRNQFRQCLGPLGDDERWCRRGTEKRNGNHWTICGAFDFQNHDDDASSLVSSSNKYQHWYKLIQDELHSIQLDLLHVRSNIVPASWGRWNEGSSNHSSSSGNSPLFDDDDENDILLIPKAS